MKKVIRFSHLVTRREGLRIKQEYYAKTQRKLARPVSLREIPSGEKCKINQSEEITYLET